MKIRQDFVTNSSSCSYIIALPDKCHHPDDMKSLFGVIYTEQATRLYEKIRSAVTIEPNNEVCDKTIAALIEAFPGEPESCQPYKKYLNFGEEPQEPHYDSNDFDKEYDDFSAARQKWYDEWDNRTKKIVTNFVEQNRNKIVVAMEFASDDGDRIDSDLRCGLVDSMDHTDLHYIQSNNS